MSGKTSVDLKRNPLVSLGLSLVLAVSAAFAEETVTEAATEAAPARTTTVERSVRSRGALTDAQRAELRERRKKMMEVRKAETEARALEIVRKYVPDEEKAKALLAELESVLSPQRRRPRPQPVGAASAEKVFEQNKKTNTQKGVTNE